MATTDPRWVLDDLGRLALRASSRAEFFDEAALRLKRVLPFDGACWHTLDPGSDLITQHRLQDIPDRFPVLADNEYAVDDVNKFADLAAAPRKAATLSEATGGHPERSPRFRDLLSPAGIGPELRSAFVADGTTWGALILVRRAGEPDFEDRDVELLSRASSLFARAVRRGLVAEATEPAPTLDADAGAARRRRARRGQRPHPGLVDSRAAAGRAVRHHARGRPARPGPVRGGQRHADEHPEPPHRDGQDARRPLARAPRRPHGDGAPGTSRRSSSSARTRPSSRRCCSRPTA